MVRDGEASRAAGWREWCALPELGIRLIKAKLDTGARTSALHAFAIRPFVENGRMRVRFVVHPLQGRSDVTVACVADVVDRRGVTNTGGLQERRFIIRTRLAMGRRSWPIEVALTNRRKMRFRMLLGRLALQGHLAVDPARSYLCGRPQATGRAVPELPDARADGKDR